MKIVWGDVAVRVADAKRSAAWWKKLGFEVRDETGHWVTVAPPGSKEMILHLCEGEGHEEGNTGIGFFVDDVDEVEKAWTGKGVKFSVPRRVGSASVQARFLDPDGNEYWLFEDEDLKETPASSARRVVRAAPQAKKSAKKTPARRKPAKRARTLKQR